MRPGAIALMPPGVLGNGLSTKLRLLGGFPYYAPRTSSITQSRGSGTPTIVRATTATVMGYAAGAVLADGQTLLTVASGELRHQGARRISEGVWSTVDADGVAIPAATLDGSVVEAAATNLCLQSQDFSTTWILGASGTTNPVVTANQSVAPDGTTTADKIEFPAVPSGAGNRSVVYQGINQTAVAYADSIYLKGDVGGEVVRIASSPDGTTWQSSATLTLTTSWERYQITGTRTAATWYLHIGVDQRAGHTLPTSAQTIYAWGAQVELGSYATAYQATTTAAVTRNKDVLDDQVSGNLTAAAGSAAFQWTPSHAPIGTIALAGSYVDASNYTAILHDATNYIFRKRIAGTNYDATLTASFVSGTTYKIAATWGASGTQIAVDGVAGTAHANTTAAQLGTRWQWGADDNGGQQAGAALEEMYLSPESMSDAELQTITR